MGKSIINAGCGCQTEHGLWFVHYVLRILFYYDFSQKKITKAKLIPESNEKDICPYSAIVECNGKIFIFPSNADTIWVYDIKLDKFEKIDYKLPNNGVFRGAYKYGAYIYAVPYTYDRVIKVDLNNYNVDKINSFAMKDNEKVFANSSSLYKDSLVVCAVPASGYYVAFDMKKEKWERITISNTETNYTFIACDYDSIYAFDINSKQIKKINYQGDVLSESIVLKYPSVAMITLPNGGVALTFTQTGEVQLFDSSLNCVQEIALNVIKDSLNSQYLHVHWIKGETDVWGITKGNELLHIDKENNVSLHEICIGEDLWKNLGETIFLEEKKIHKENSILNLEIFINSVTKEGKNI